VRIEREPPGTAGHRIVPPNSAKTRASTISIAAARTQDRIAAGPAAVVALNALSSQPEPRIDPRDTNISPQKPTDRCSPVPAFGVFVWTPIVVSPREHMTARRTRCAQFINA
jgi:hypothetical protein